MVKYKVHRFEIGGNNSHLKLAKFLNSLKGEVVSIIPEIKTVLLCYGAKVKTLLIVEKLKK
jgi:hypothetical protein